MTKSLEKTTRENTSALEQSNRDLEQFAYIAAHDLQEPLRMLSVYLQTLARQYGDQLPPRGRSLIDLSLQASNRMRLLINDLLTYSRPNTEGQGFQPVSTNEVFDETVQNLRLAIDEHAALVTRADLPVVRGSHSQLVQLLQNLINNGIKFHSDAPPRVHVAAQREGEFWRFSVRDTGIGIPMAQSQRIFEIFQRLPASAVYPGTGVGLAACQRIVQRHGGQIWFESESGQGTTFFFTLPTWEPESEDPQAPKVSDQASTALPGQGGEVP